MKDLISVCIPVYNGEKYIRGAIDSVLAQKDVNIEVIVYSDGSTDRTDEKAFMNQDARVIFSECSENKGIGFARKKLVEKAKGKYITFLSHDDYYATNDFLAQNKLYYEKHRGYFKQPYLLYSGYVATDERNGSSFHCMPLPYALRMNGKYWDFPQDDIRTAIYAAALKNTMFTNLSTIFGETETFKKYAFNAELRQSEDLDFVLRTAVLGRVPYAYTGINDGLVYRTGDNTTSRTFLKIPLINHKIFCELFGTKGAKVAE